MLRALGVICVVLIVLMGTAFAVLRVEFEGPSLGDNIASLLNKRMRGRISIGSVEWDSASLKTVIAGGWVPLRVKDVDVWDDCALSSPPGGEFRTTDPNEDCTPDDHPDPDPASKRVPRKKLIHARTVTAEVDIHALMFGNHDFVFRHVNVSNAEALLEQTREPYPLHAYDRTITSIISAFYPRMKAGFRAGIYADAPPPVFELRDIHVDHLTLTAHFSPYNVKAASSIGYGVTARLLDVTVDTEGKDADKSYLYMNATDPLVAKFYVRLAIKASSGTLQIQDEGPRAAFHIASPNGADDVYPPKGRDAKYTLHLVDIDLDRLAQLPSEWPRHDFVANTLELGLSARTIPCPELDNPSPRKLDGAELRLTGDLEKYWDRPYDGTWDLRLEGKNLGPTVRSCIKSKVGGDDMSGTITLTGPFVAAPKLTADLRNVGFDLPLKKSEDPIRLTLAEIHGGIDLVNEQGYLEKTKALIAGGKEPGEVDLSATFGLKPYNANAVIEIPKAVDIGRFLPPKIRTSVGKFASGRLSAKGDVDEGFALEDFDLALGPTATDKAIRVFHGRLFTDNNFGTIQFDKVDVEAGRSKARFDGQVDTRTTVVDMTIDGSFPDLDVWLKKFGLPPLFRSANGGVIHITGKLGQPKIDARTTLAGVPCIDTLRLDAVTIQNGIVDVQAMSSPGLGGRISGTARLRLGAVPYIEKLHLTGAGLEAAKLCGLAGKVKGTLDTVDVNLHGSIDQSRKAMDWLALASVYATSQHLSIYGDGYRAVAACLNQGNDTRCRPRGLTYLDTGDRALCDDAKRVAGGFCLVASATHEAGGTVDATVAKLPAITVARKTVPAHLGGTIALADVPLALIDQFTHAKDAPPILGGFAGAVVHLSGSPDAPRGTGAIDLVRTWAERAFIGDARLDVAPVTLGTTKKPMPGLAVHGTALAGRLVIDGTIGTVAPYPVEVVLHGHAVEVDQFIDVAAKLKLDEPVQAWASGVVTLKTELAPLDGRPPAPEAWVELSDVRVVYNHRGTDGRITPLQLTSAAPSTAVPDDRPTPDPELPGRPAVSLRVTPTTVELACRDPKSPTGRTPCPTKLDARPLGAPGHALVAALRGRASKSLVEITVDGQLELSRLQPLVDERFDQVSGTARLRAAINGTWDAPKFEASAELDHVLLRPIGGDTLLEAPGGLIKLANGSLGFSDLVVNVRDERRDDSQGQLEIHGGITLDGLTPSAWGVFVTGRLAAKLLLVLAPTAVSQASGVATIGDDAIRLWGKGPRPLIAGSLSFDGDQPVTVLPRGLRHELAFSRGTVEITTCGGNLAPADQDPDCTGAVQGVQVYGDHRAYRIAVSDVGGKYDNEGLITSVSGAVALRDGELSAVDMSLDAENVPFRIPGSLDLVVSMKGIGVSYDGDQWRARGAVSIVSGTYKTEFDLADRITKIGQSAPPSKPFWETYPALGAADLNLTLDVRKFTVDNNIATIDFAGKDIEITQTPRDPRLSGSINVLNGRFRIPGTRADFTNTRGSVDFAENVKAANPHLAVTSEANYRDLSGQEHLITLTINGSLDQPQWDLKTSTGYNKSQTLSLLVLGRNQEQLRRSLGDQSLGTDPLHVDPTTNPSAGFADQIVKDLAGDWVSGLIGTSLTKIVPVDILRFDIGFGSVGVHFEKKVFENARVIGDAEQTIRGSTTNFRAEIKTPYKITDGNDSLTLQGGSLNKNYTDPAELDIVDRSVKLVLRLFLW